MAAAQVPQTFGGGAGVASSSSGSSGLGVQGSGSSTESSGSSGGFLQISFGGAKTGMVAPGSGMGFLATGGAGSGSGSQCKDMDAEVKAGRASLKGESDWSRKFATIEEFQNQGETKGIYAGTSFQKAKKDYCKSPKELVEYSCNDAGYLSFKVVTCPMGCNDGKCASLPYCIDTDKGEKSLSAGRVWYLVEGKTPEGQVGKCKNLGGTYACFLRDYCEGDVLHEFSCLTEISGGDYTKETEIECSAGCTRGKCNLAVTGSTPGTLAIGSSDEPEGIVLALDKPQTINGKKVTLKSMPLRAGAAAQFLIEEPSSGSSTGGGTVTLFGGGSSGSTGSSGSSGGPTLFQRA